VAAVIPGYHGKLLEVDLSAGKTSTRILEEQTLKQYLGGTGLGAALLFDELEAGADPLGEDNILMFLAGPFAGTRVPCGDRTSVVCKSPLTGIWADSDVGGRFAGTLRSSGYDGILVRGRAESPVYLHVEEERAIIRSAGRLWGQDSYRTDELLRGRHGSRLSTMAIGPAGENQVLLSSIVSDGKDARVAARCGVGAVMGSKLLKAVAVERGRRQVLIYDEEGLRESVRKAVRLMTELSESLRELGTSGSVEECHRLGDFPIKNWQLREWPRAANLDGAKLAATILRARYHCARCPIGCGRVVRVSQGEFRTPQAAGGPEYETMGSLGGNLMIDNIEAVALANDLCNRYGLDTISIGQAVGLAYESFDRGYLGRNDVDGLQPVWGDPRPLISLVRLIGERRGFGAVLGQGVRRACRQIASGAQELSLEVKGLELPSHDPRAFASIALGYATSPRGACHLQAYSHGLEAWLAMPELGFPEIMDRFSIERKAEMTARMQDLMSVFDSLKMCKFVLYAGINIRTLVEWLNLVTGWGFDQAELMRAGEKIFSLKRSFNRREGLSREQDRLPGRFIDGPIGKQLPRMLEEYYRIREPGC
jgi:aldehyde:ferredoxin oxidoreductase